MRYINNTLILLLLLLLLLFDFYTILVSMENAMTFQFNFSESLRHSDVISVSYLHIVFFFQTASNYSFASAFIMLMSTREEKQIINLSQTCFTLCLSVIECRQEPLVHIVSSSDVFQKTRFSWPYLVLLGNNPHPNTHGLWIQSVSKWKHFSLLKSSAQNVRLAFPARTSDGHHTYGTFDLSQSVQCLAYDAEHFTIFFFSLRIFSRLRVPAAVVWKAKRNCLVLHYTARLKWK